MTLDEGLQGLGLNLSAAGRNRLLAYGQLLEKWNKTFNLTALRGQDKILTHHLLDSLSLVPHVDAGPVLDVGSGAGMPGIPLALARPDLAVILMESASKKVAFQKQACIELGISNVQAVCSRVEDYQPEQPFARITSRAFSDLALFVSLTRHLLAAGGRWLAMKGQLPEEEIRALPEDIVVLEILQLQVPGLTGERHLVVMGVKQ